MFYLEDFEWLFLVGVWRDYIPGDEHVAHEVKCLEVTYLEDNIVFC